MQKIQKGQRETSLQVSPTPEAELMALLGLLFLTSQIILTMKR